MNVDRHVEAVRAKLLDRSTVGQQKYGTTLERTDLELNDWIRHAQEESLDLAVYLERLASDLVISANHKPQKPIGGNCEFCKAPSIEARFRLMEAAYHEDMAEVYKRLEKLEKKCLNL